jgi:predicted Fe-Mo cluster-binding NifX family protein
VRIALTIHGGRIAPVFDAAQRLLIVDLDETPARRREVDLAGASPLERVRLVRETGADELVCGAITRTLRHLLEARGVRVRPWVALDVESALRMVAERKRRTMKIVVSALDRGPDARIDPRFGRAPWYVIHDTEDGSYESVPNPNVDAPSGAGIQAAQLVLDSGARVLITGRCGPNAYGTLRAGGVIVHSGFEGTVREAVEAHAAGRLVADEGPTSPGHAAIGPGPGFGRGGGGRGYGRGGGGGGGGGGRGGGRGGGGGGRGGGRGGGGGGGGGGGRGRGGRGRKGGR